MIRTKAHVARFYSNKCPTLQKFSSFNMGIKYLNLMYERELALTTKPDKRERDTSMELSRSFAVPPNLFPTLLNPHVQLSSAITPQNL